MENQTNQYKWLILALAFFTDMIVVAIPSMGLAVLSKEISLDLHLNLVQVGVIWGIGAVPTILTSLLGGTVGDIFGAKRVLIVSSLLTGLLGAARGWANSYLSMLIITLVGGAVAPFVTMNALKIAGQWFPKKQLGLANGILGMGMASGFLLGALLSASTFSPLLGGWRNVLITYGIAGALFAVPWLFTRSAPAGKSASAPHVSLFGAVRRVAGLRNIWLQGLVMFGIFGCIQGVLGYLPLYLRNLGWTTLRADSAVSSFHLASLLFVVPIAFLSDRLGSRKPLLLLATLAITLGTGLLSISSGGWILPAVLMIGFLRDSFMSISFAMTIEMDGVGSDYAGTAVGFIVGIGSIASVIAPPIGNSLAKFSLGAPFILWSGLALLAVICLLQIKPKTQSAVEIPMDKEPIS